MATRPIDDFDSFLRANNYVHVHYRGTDQYVCLHRLLFHWTMIEGTIGDTFGYDDRWCYSTEALALSALHEWEKRGYDGEPTGWHRHPRTGRRRDGGDMNKETIDG